MYIGREKTHNITPRVYIYNVYVHVPSILYCDLPIVSPSGPETNIRLVYAKNVCTILMSTGMRILYYIGYNGNRYRL